MFAKKLTSDRFDRRLVQLAAFAGAPIVLLCCTRLVHQVATDPGQVVIGTLTACALSIAMVTLGLAINRPAPE